MVLLDFLKEWSQRWSWRIQTYKNFAQHLLTKQFQDLYAWKKIHDRQQIKLVDNKISVIYKGKTYKYIFYLVDVFHVFTAYDLL